MAKWGTFKWGDAKWGAGAPSVTFTVSQTGDFELTLVFSEIMELDGAPGLALVDPLSYQLTSLGIGAGASVESVEVDNNTTVKLTIGLTTDGEDYRVTILGALESEAGDPATGETDDYTASVGGPQVSKVVPQSSTVLRVTFNRAMVDNADLVDVSNYQITAGSLTLTGVTRISPTEVDVSTSEQVEDELYGLQVNP